MDEGGREAGERWTREGGPYRLSGLYPIKIVIYRL